MRYQGVMRINDDGHSTRMVIDWARTRWQWTTIVLWGAGTFFGPLIGLWIIDDANGRQPLLVYGLTVSIAAALMRLFYLKGKGELIIRKDGERSITPTHPSETITAYWEYRRQEKTIQAELIRLKVLARTRGHLDPTTAEPSFDYL